MKYRKKPVEIEAIQLTEDNTCEVLTFCNSHNDIVASNDNGTVSIRTLEGTMVANVGDYVIRGVKGEYYPCKPDIFEATYDKVEDEMLATTAPVWVDMRMKFDPAEIANIAEWLRNDPRMTKVEFDSTANTIHFEIEYGEEAGDEAGSASFTIYSGATIARVNNVYRLEYDNEQ